MTTARLVPVLFFLVFLASPPTFSGQLTGGMIQMARRTTPFLKGFKSGWKWYNKYKKVDEYFQNLGVVTSPGEKNLNLDDIYEGMFTFELGVGSPPQQVTALLSISSLITWINNYQPANGLSTFRCCEFITGGIADCNIPTCPSNSPGYFLVQDRFTFYSNGYLDTLFEGSPSGASDSASPIGVISFSRSRYSVVSNLPTKQFSYFFSYNSTKNSSISLGNSVSSIPRSELQSTQLIGYTYPNYYTHLYFVNLIQISVGDKSVAIDPKTDFTYGVILDTIIPLTLLAERAYDKVKSVIVARLGQPVASNSFDMCYDNSTQWPSLALFFSGYSGYPQMVLRKENYVLTDDDGLECVAILPTSMQGISVIGTMAQLDRQMIFDVEQSTLYFDRYPEIVFSCDTKPTILLNLVVVHFILLLLCW